MINELPIPNADELKMVLYVLDFLKEHNHDLRVEDYTRTDSRAAIESYYIFVDPKNGKEILGPVQGALQNAFETYLKKGGYEYEIDSEDGELTVDSLCFGKFITPNWVTYEGVEYTRKKLEEKKNEHNE